MFGWEWRCSWSITDRRCSNYIWVINNFIACWGALILEVWQYIGLTFSVCLLILCYFVIPHVCFLVPTALNGFFWYLAQMIIIMRGCVTCNDFWPWLISSGYFGHEFSIKTAKILHILWIPFCDNHSFEQIVYIFSTNDLWDQRMFHIWCHVILCGFY